VIFGSPTEVAGELLSWAQEADVDGFNLVRVVMPETLESFVDLVVPELQSRGVFKTTYRDGTLREKLFPGDTSGLRTSHPGRRLSASGSSSIRATKAAFGRFHSWPLSTRIDALACRPPAVVGGEEGEDAGDVYPFADMPKEPSVKLVRP
jgi:hypothetical protein